MFLEDVSNFALKKRWSKLIAELPRVVASEALRILGVPKKYDLPVWFLSMSCPTRKCSRPQRKCRSWLARIYCYSLLKNNKKRTSLRIPLASLTSRTSGIRNLYTHATLHLVWPEPKDFEWDLVAKSLPWRMPKKKSA